jgi:hypothetical protein
MKYSQTKFHNEELHDLYYSPTSVTVKVPLTDPEAQRGVKV